MKYLLVITRENRAERPSEAYLTAIAQGVESAIGAGTPIPAPTDDSFLLLSSVGDITARITKYLSSPRYATLSPALNDGYFIVKYQDDQTIADDIALEIFETFSLQVYLVSGEDFYMSLPTLQEAKDYISTLGASDGYNLIGDKAGASSQYISCRPPLRKENNHCLVDDLNVVNSWGRSEVDRF